MGQKIVDSGSSSHMSKCREIFATCEDIDMQKQVAKKGSVVDVHGIGNIKSKECELSRVLYSPQLCRNLMSEK